MAKKLFIGMMEEEWRMHTDLFGSVRFALFPVLIALLVTGASYLLTWVGIDLMPVLLGVHVLVAFFGLQTGSIVFIGRDAFENVLGETTFLMYSARTLPVTYRYLMTIFLLKDIVYYAILFLIPITIGFGITGVSLTQLLILWLTLTGTFALGVTLSISLISLIMRTPFAKVAGISIAALIGGAVFTGVDITMWTPYEFFINPSVTAFVTGFILIPITAVTSLLLFDPTHERETRTKENQYNSLKEHFQGKSLLTVTILDLHRSSGGIFKVLFSGLLLFAVTSALLALAERIVGIPPSTGLAFGSLLALTAFTTYNWLTQNDDIYEYLFLPISIKEVFRAKFEAFVVLTLPVGGLLYLAAVIVNGATLIDSVVGLVVFAGMSMYLFGLTVYLAGFSPNEFLFDTVLFSAFTAAVAIAVVPLLIIAFIIQPLTPALLAGVIVGAGVLGYVGYFLIQQAPERWTENIKQ